MTEQRLTISRLGRRGEGLTDNQVAVAGTLPGETVRAEVDGERGRLLTVESPSPERVAPFCRYFGRCGGCQLQHWAAAPYRRWKAEQVQQALARNGIETIVAGPLDAHGSGRRRISLHVRKRDGVVTAGFMAARSHDLLDIDLCPVLEPALAAAPELARAIGMVLGDCDAAITASAVGLDVNVKAERKVVVAEHAKLAGLAQRLGLARLAVNAETIVTHMAPFVTMGRARVNLPSGSFLQATAAGEQALAELVLAGCGRAKSVADLFSGLGPFALRIAEHIKVQAFDSDRAAIEQLRAAVRLTQGLKPLGAEVRDLMREPLVPGELKEFDTVVFDPPRAGAEAQARQLARSAVATVVAVSCDPVTLARDAGILLAGGYDLLRVTAVDQFKWSSHVESVAVFGKRKAGRRPAFP